MEVFIVLRVLVLQLLQQQATIRLASSLLFTISNLHWTKPLGSIKRFAVRVTTVSMVKSFDVLPVCMGIRLVCTRQLAGTGVAIALTFNHLHYHSGPCAAGYYCPIASVSSMQFPCGSSRFYCPEGSAKPIPTDRGFCSTGGDETTRTYQSIAPIGHYAWSGECYKCPAGRYAIWFSVLHDV